MVEPQDRVLVLTITDHCCQVHSEDCPGIAPMKAGTLAGEEMCAKLPGLGQIRGQTQKVLRGSANHWAMLSPQSAVLFPVGICRETVLGHRCTEGTVLCKQR